MRFSRGLLAGLVAAGLVACSSSGPRPASPSSTAPTKTAPAAAPASQAEPATEAGARTAAAHFYRLYLASQFAASWDLLAPAAKRQVPRGIWIRVHEGCSSATAGRARIIKSVTVFGNAAIVTERLTGTRSRHRTAEDVFNYARGRWGYSPSDLSIYHHRSVAADIGAAKAAGFCGSRKASPL